MPESKSTILERAANTADAGQSPALDSSARDVQLQKIIRNVLTLGVVVVPIMAYIDYQLDYMLVAMVEVFGAVTIPLLLWLSEKPANLRMIVHITLGYLFLLFSAVAISQLDSSASLLWYPLIPILFFYLSHFWAGLIWSTALFIVLVVAYFNYPEISSKAPVSELFFLHTIITYIAGTAIGAFFELKGKPSNINFQYFDDEE